MPTKLGWHKGGSGQVGGEGRRRKWVEWLRFGPSGFLGSTPAMQQGQNRGTHRGGSLPWSKGRNVPLPWGGFPEHQSCTGFNAGLPASLFQHSLGLCFKSKITIIRTYCEISGTMNLQCSALLCGLNLKSGSTRLK